MKLQAEQIDETVFCSAKPTYFMLLAGPSFFIFTLLSKPVFSGMNRGSWLILGLTLWMAAWWISEAAPIPATSLLPIVIVPLSGLDSISQACAPYAHELIFLFLGGFLLSIAMEHWNLHQRIALLTMLAVGGKPSRQIGAIMLVTAFLSMWMSNTATAVMMLPIGLSIITGRQHDSGQSDDFARALMLAIAYAASIGGIATLIGTPPNALLAAYLHSTYGITVSFSKWLLFGLPLAAVMLLLCWFWLTRMLYRVNRGPELAGRSLFQEKLCQLGKTRNGERMVLLVFCLAASAWILRAPLARLSGLPLSDSLIAVFAAVLLFVLPVELKSGRRIIGWDDCRKLPWGVLLLFGGGLSLATQIQKSGLAEYIAAQLSSLGHLNQALLILLVTTVIIFLTEITSNTATAAAFLPLLGPIGLALQGSALFLTLPAAIAASCAFMMPVATPPNAIIFASGRVAIRDMVKAGLLLNLASIPLITLASLYLGRLLP